MLDSRWVSAQREIMTWDDLGAGTRALAHAIHDDGFRPDMVLAIARGGMLVASALGYALGVKNTFTMNVEFYTGVDQRLEMPMILPPVPDLVDFAETRVLIADDVADTGATLALVKSFCEGTVAEARCAVLYQKPWARSRASTSGAGPTAGSPSPGAPSRRSASRSAPSQRPEQAVPPPKRGC